MKKQLLIASMVLLGSSSFAQTIAVTNSIKPIARPNVNLTPHPESRNMSCSNDTVFYSYLKETEVGTSTFYTTDLYDGQITEYSQTFLNTGSLTVKGISFFGMVQDFVNPGQTVVATAVLYNVDGANMPTTVITTGTILMTTAFGVYDAMFSAPVTVTGNYAVALQNTTTTDTLSVYLNNAQIATYGEGLGYLNAPLFGGWLAPAAAYGAGKAFEGLIGPIISYPIATDYTMSPATSPMCLGTALTFTNSTTPTAILSHRMYNYGAFNGYWNTVPDSIYAWDMGDGSPLIWSTNAAYTYPAAGLDTVTLFTLGGLFTSCLDTKETYISVTPNAVASFTTNISGMPMIAFTSTSTGAATYSWDFGDGSPLDNTANPSHTYTDGTYTVTLTVTSPGTCNTNMTTQVVTIVTTGITANNTSEFNVYPNPSSGMFTIDMGVNTKTSIEVYNMIGELILSQEFASQFVSIDLTGFNAGVYSMKVIANEMNVVKQIVITK